MAKVLKKGLLLLGLCGWLVSPIEAQRDTLVTYRLEAMGMASSGTYAPLWLTSNRHGALDPAPNAALLRAGATYRQALLRHWSVGAGLDLIGGAQDGGRFVIQQAYADVSWRCLNLSLGSKERNPFLERPFELGSGTLVEDGNARPVPQARIEIADYVAVPGTKRWLAFKGYIAYGRFTDDRWQEDFAAPGSYYVQDVFYHGKGALFRIGNREVRPWEVEIGLQTATQFGGKRYLKRTDGTSTLVHTMPSDLKTFLRVFLPLAGGSETTDSDQLNVEGNVLGAWVGGFTYYFPKDWTLRLYAEHYFEDESAMFFQYGMWRDGLLGVTLRPPKNCWVDELLWEGLAMDFQSGPIQYEWFNASFPGIQISACDNYYNHSYYGGWQQGGLSMGHPLLPGPAYNESHQIRFRSNRMRAHHIGISGSPFRDWQYRLKLSLTRHWGTYDEPLPEVTHQTSGLAEVTYRPGAWNGWTFSLAVAADRGGLIGNSVGGLFTIRKEGVLWRK